MTELTSRVVAILQARMGSARLPGKVLMDLGGRSALARVISRVCRAELIDEIVVATTDSGGDEPIVAESARLGVCCFRGSETDVLDRYYRTARAFEAATVIRITADCPLIDPELVDAAIKTFRESSADYVSNGIENTYPRGLDVEVFTAEALTQAWENARTPYEREHVTPYLYGHPELFRLTSLVAAPDYSKYRWTLDTPEDLELLRTIYLRFDNHDDFNWRDVIALMEREPWLADLNRNVLQTLPE